LEDLSIEGRLILDFRGMGWEGIDSIHLAQDRDQWQAHVNLKINILIS